MKENNFLGSFFDCLGFFPLTNQRCVARKNCLLEREVSRYLRYIFNNLIDSRLGHGEEASVDFFSRIRSVKLDALEQRGGAEAAVQSEELHST